MSVAMEDFPRRHRITVDEYHRMAEVGLLAPDARVELIDGEIIDMPPIGNPHMANVNRLTRLLVLAVGEGAIVQCQGGIQLGDFNEPQPDFALLVARADFYEHQRPQAYDAQLLIEVSDSSLRYDMKTKMPLYAQYGVPEYWIIDIGGKRLRVFRRPKNGRYEEQLELSTPGVMPIASLPGVTVDLSSLFRHPTPRDAPAG
jgi:Uma2 family endonuclease